MAKVGGLGDVVFGLSRELEIRGNSVEIILPKYDCLRYDQIFDKAEQVAQGDPGTLRRVQIARLASSPFISGIMTSLISRSILP